MPAKITFTKKEEAALQATCEYFNKNGGLDLTYIYTLLEKMRVAREPVVKFKGVDVKWVLGRCDSTLGKRFAKPEVMTGAWFSKMQRALNDNGITQDIAEKAIQFVHKNWGDNIWVETLIYSMAKIAAGGMPDSGKNSKRIGFSPSKKSGWLSQLEDSDSDEETVGDTSTKK